MPSTKSYLFRLFSDLDYVNLYEEFTLNYSSHPNTPSLYAITDTFSQIGIVNVAAVVDKSYYDDLPISFLAVLQGEYDDLVYV